jgi:hypothetical protein
VGPCSGVSTYTVALSSENPRTLKKNLKNIASFDTIGPHFQRKNEIPPDIFHKEIVEFWLLGGRYRCGYGCPFLPLT